MTISDILQIAMLAFSLGLGGFCLLLAGRLRRLNDLETGLGGAIAVMTSEISRLERSIHAAKSEATIATVTLGDEIERAKEERAFWMLQKKFAHGNSLQATRPQRRRRRANEQVADA